MKLKRLLPALLVCLMAVVLPLRASAAQITLDVTGIESAHNYSSYTNQTWELSSPGALSITMTFDSRTSLESGFDYLYLYDAAGTEVGKYSGTTLAGQTVTVNSDKVTLKLTSDSSNNKWGFKVTSAYAVLATPCSVTLGETEHGTLLLDQDSYCIGSTVTVTAVPDEGYWLKTVLVNGEAIPGTVFTATEDCVVTAEFVSDPLTAITDGACGEGLTWTLRANGELVISGTGTMETYEAGSAPWYPWRSRITAITVEDAVSAISAGAFSGCAAVERLTVPYVGSSLKTAEDTEQYPLGYIFGAASYDGGSKTTQYYYGSSPSSTTSTAYCIPASLRSVTVTGGNILRGAFYGCSMLTEINVPNTVTDLGSYAFYSCSNLTSFTIPNSVTSIGEDAFYRCTSLTSITVPAGVTSLPRYVFDGCSGLTRVDLPAGLTSIGFYAFRNCVSLTEIRLPAGLTDFTVDALYGCTALANIYTDAENASYASVDGVLFSKDLSTVILYPVGRTAETYAIPAGTTTVGSSAFASCKYLTAVTVPNSVTSIGSDAFEYCSALTSVNIPEGVTSLSGTFQGCSALTEINLPSTLTSLGTRTFYACRNLKQITIPAGVTSVGEFTFEGCSALASVTFPNGLRSIGQSAFENCDALTELNLPDSVGSISYSAFSGCDGLTEVDLPASLSAVMSYVFSNCSNLRRVTVPAGVTSIREYAFRYCKLDEVRFMGSAPTVNSYAFSGATAKLYYPADTTAVTDAWKSLITSSALNGTLTWIPYSTAAVTAQGTFGDGLTWTLDANGVLIIAGDGSMPDYTAGAAPWYRYRGSIKEAVVGGDIDYLGSYAFYGCSNLKLIRLTLEWAPNFHDNAFSSIRTTVRYYPEMYNWYPGRMQDYGGTVTWVPVGESDTLIASGEIDYDITWTLDYDGLLTVSGSGKIPDYGYGGAPWSRYDYLVTSLEVGTSIYYVGDRAFYGLSQLEEAHLFYWATSMELGDEVFYGCSSLKTLSMAGAGKIGAEAFYNCTSLTEIYINDSSSLSTSYLTIAKDSFKNVVATVYYPRGVTCWMNGYGASTYGGNLTWTEADFGVCGVDMYWRFDETTGRLTMYGPGRFFPYRSGNIAPWGKFQTEVTSVYVEDGVTYIPEYIFEYLSKATAIRLPDTLEMIALTAFNDCSSLNNLLLPASLTAFDPDYYGNTFLRCPALTDVYYLGTEEDWAQVERSSEVTSYDSTMTVHYLVLHKGTVTCTASGTPDYYLFDDTSVYSSMYNLEKRPINSLSAVPALGHSYTDRPSDRVAYPATCSSPALYYTRCDRCDQISGSKTVASGEKADHLYTAYTSNGDATCFADGTESASCDFRCGTVDTRTDEGSRLTHSYTEYTPNGDATCTADGTETALCDHNCGTGDTRTDEGSMIPHSHTEYTSNGDATCTADGTETSFCDYGCGHKDTRTDEDSMIPHSHTEYTSNGDATCTADGTETASCDYGCGHKDTRTDEGSMIPHSHTAYTSNGDATCTADGTETSSCDYGCGHKDTRIDEGSMIPHSHTAYTSNGDATCTADGTETSSCDYGCGHKDTRTDEGSRLGHSFSAWETVVEPTYIEDGLKYRLCLRPDCDHEEEDILPATGPELIANVGVICDSESRSVILTNIPADLTVMLAVYREGRMEYTAIRVDASVAISFILPEGLDGCSASIFFLTDSWIPIAEPRFVSL